jgi:hypothetical protein
VPPVTRRLNVPLALVVAVVVAVSSAGSAVAAAKGSRSLALGAYVSGAPWNPALLDGYASLVGRMPAIVMWYQDWGTPGVNTFDPARMEAVTSRGSTPMVTWDPWAWNAGPEQPLYAPSRIASGSFDPYIREWARAARSWGKRLYLRFAHEMNASYYPWGVGNNGNTAEDFVNAWRRVVDIFRQEGATEVRWVWAPNVAFSGTAPFHSVYPGRSYVDVIGVDGYNWGTSVSWHRWQSFTGVFAKSYDALAKLDTRKPMMIAETASAEEGGDKAAWIRSAFFTELPSRFPRITAVVWFHERKETAWEVNSSAASLSTFREVVADRSYHGRLP